MNFDWIDLVGMFAGFVTSIISVPQAIRVIRTGKTKEVIFSTYILLALSYSSWFTYGFLKNLFPIILWNAVGLFFTVIVLFLKSRDVYKSNRT